jgi:hypothetical protein
MPELPRTFIGSSSEGKVVAEAIATHLQSETTCKVWTEGVFLPGRTFIETLEKLLTEMDYAILVATPDDVLTKRDVQSFSMRDNVLLELGLFMARLGRRHTYLVTPVGHMHIPSDLWGMTTASYENPTERDSWLAALEKPCEVIRAAMREAGDELSSAMRRTLVKKLLGWTTRIQGLLVTLQAQSARCLTDRQKFEDLRADISHRISEAVAEYQDDANRLTVGAQYESLASSVLDAVATFPFPEEVLVSSADVVRSGIGMIFGRVSVESQINDRLNALVSRYDTWWSATHPGIAKSLHELQTALVVAI